MQIPCLSPACGSGLRPTPPPLPSNHGTDPFAPFSPRLSAVLVIVSRMISYERPQFPEINQILGDSFEGTVFLPNNAVSGTAGLINATLPLQHNHPCQAQPSASAAAALACGIAGGMGSSLSLCA